MENHIRQRTIDLLKQNKQGLTLLEIAKALSVNRVTISKYIYGLIAEGLVLQRLIGPAKLCYLCPQYAELEKLGLKDNENKEIVYA
jgi:predicted transcriptional regulator